MALLHVAGAPILIQNKRLDGSLALRGLAAVKIVCLAIQPPSILFYLFPCFIAFYQPFDPLVRVKQVADRGVMVQGVYNIGNVFAHVTVDVVRPV